MMDDDLDAMDVLDDRMLDKLEILEQLEIMKKALKIEFIQKKD